MSCESLAIQIQNISKCYQIYDRPQDRLKHALIPRLERLFGRSASQYGRKFWALKDVSFDVKKGEVLGVVGKNGSGKSTLLQIICGTLTPTDGTVTVLGRVGALLELGAGFNPEFSGRENIYLSGMLLGLSRQEMDDRVDQIIAFADIGEFVDQPVKTFSSGMFARLAFSVQSSLDPEILIVDEALAVGDSQFVHKCMLRFHQMREQGKTILLVTHDATAVKTLCDRAVWIDKGEVSGIGEASLIVDEYLARISGQAVVRTQESQRHLSAEKDQRNEVEDELQIPNVDQRYGDQSCRIVGIGLYDAQLKRRLAVNNNSNVVVRVTFENCSLDPGTRLIVGLGLRNSRGVDIASVNSESFDTNIRAPNVGHRCTIRANIYLPELHPGSYSFRIAISHIGKDGEKASCDDILNALVFDLLSARVVHVLMSLNAEFEVE